MGLRADRELPGEGDGGGVIARVIAVEGFSTWSDERLAVIDADGRVRSGWLGRYGEAWLSDVARRLPPGSSIVTHMDISGPAVAEAGLNCGGRLEVLVQPRSSIPSMLWQRLAERVPVALLTWLDGSGLSLVIDPDGKITTVTGGDAGGQVADTTSQLVREAVAFLATGQPATRRLEGGNEAVLLEVWVPNVRLVTVGGGQLASALDAQAALLGWETRTVENTEGLDDALAWAGGSSALVVLSHDPHVDGPALRKGLARQARYIGALGSRRTQGRRTERLLADGVDAEALERIHRPIGLDLGGRSASEVALAICAEILADRCGRGGRSLGAGAPIAPDKVAERSTEGDPPGSGG